MRRNDKFISLELVFETLFQKKEKRKKKILITNGTTASGQTVSSFKAPKNTVRFTGTGDTFYNGISVLYNSTWLFFQRNLF